MEDTILDPFMGSAPFLLQFRLSSQIRGGKNNMLMTKTGRHYPNKSFVAWRQEATEEMDRSIRYAPIPIKLPLADKLRATIAYCPQDKRRRDVPAMLDALWHLIEHIGLIKDDAQIKEVVWREVKQDCCVVVRLEALGETIYVPTEANLPILEATRRPSQSG